jgi:hypothetical protein
MHVTWSRIRPKHYKSMQFMNSSDRVCIDRHECKIVEVLNVKY